MSMFQSKTKKLFTLLFLFVVSASAALAQQTFGSIRGEVKDVQGGLISNAQVTLTNEATKVTRTDTSNSAGLYLFGGLDPGTYKVTITVPGFKTFESVGNIVSVGSVGSVDAVLQIGGSSETVEVTSDTLVLSTASASGGQLFDTKQVEDLPLLGRNPFMLGAFMPTSSFSATRATSVLKIRRVLRRSRLPALRPTPTAMS